MSSRARRRGFTLIEVLVAMVVMAIMSLMAWQGVDGIARTRESNQVRLEQVLRLETVIAQWEQDLASIQDESGTPTLMCDGQSVRLIRSTEGGLQVVAWSLRPDSQNAVWQRWASPAATTTANLSEMWLRTFQFQGSEAGQLRTLSGLEAWKVFYFFQGSNGWANCQSSADVATPVSGKTTQTRLPIGVRIELTFATGSGLAATLVRDVRIEK